MMAENMRLRESELVLRRDNEEQSAKCQNLQAERALRTSVREKEAERFREKIKELSDNLHHLDSQCNKKRFKI